MRSIKKLFFIFILFAGASAWGVCPTITLNDTLSDGSVGSQYVSTVTASGGTAPYTYAITAGALPTGVSLSSAGALTGTPTTANIFTFTITATDADLCTGANSSYSVTIDPIPVLDVDSNGNFEWFKGTGSACWQN